MPKQKTHKGVSKRFKVTGTGKIKRRRAFGSHLLTKKSASRKRRLKQPTIVVREESKKIKKLMPYSHK